MKSRWIPLALPGLAVAVLILLAAALVDKFSPSPLYAAVSPPSRLAGDSVRFVATFQPPAGADSIVVVWKLGAITRTHSLAGTAAVDTMRFAAGPGFSGSGSVRIYVWDTDLSSPGITRVYNVIIPAPTPPADVAGFALADSAVVF